jgi:hypothetical protein
MPRLVVLLVAWACIALSALPLIMGWGAVGGEAMFATRCLVGVGVILNLAILLCGD